MDLLSISNLCVTELKNLTPGKLQEHNKCRVCLSRGDIPIFGTKKDLSTDLRLIGGVDINVQDEYPKHLCKTCHGLLKGAILLRELAQDSEQVLKQGLLYETCDDDDDLETVVKRSKLQPVDHDYARSDDKLNVEELKCDDEEPETQFNLIKNEKQNVENDVKEIKIRKKSLNDEILQQYNKDIETNLVFENVEHFVFNCRLCKISFKSNLELGKHKAEKHGEVRIKCPICNQSYSDTYIKTHIALHRSDKPVLCDICGKRFAIKATMKAHRISHTNELPFKCSYCPYRSRTKHYLSVHIRTHTNDKPYQCPHCPNRFFANSSNLKKHLFTHSTDYAFQCDQCGKGYHRKKLLEEHIKVEHLGLKEYICNICGKEFGKDKRMKKHQLKVHFKNRPKRKYIGMTPLYIKLSKSKENPNKKCESSKMPEETMTTAVEYTDDNSCITET